MGRTRVQGVRRPEGFHLVGFGAESRGKKARAQLAHEPGVIVLAGVVHAG